MSVTELVPVIRSFVIENFMFGSGGETLQNDDSFVDRGIIDSTGVLELVSFIEETFAISVDDEELVPANLDSIDRVACYVSGKLAAG